MRIQGKKRKKPPRVSAALIALNWQTNVSIIINQPFRHEGPDLVRRPHDYYIDSVNILSTINKHSWPEWSEESRSQGYPLTLKLRPRTHAGGETRELMWKYREIRDLWSLRELTLAKENRTEQRGSWRDRIPICIRNIHK